MSNARTTETLTRIQGLLEGIVKELVDVPEKVHVSQTVSSGGDTIVMTVTTANGEVGKLIGKDGRNATAIRRLLDAFAAKYKCRIILEVDDPRKRKRERSHSDAGRNHRR